MSNKAPGLIISGIALRFSYYWAKKLTYAYSYTLYDTLFSIFQADCEEIILLFKNEKNEKRANNSSHDVKL